jgi:hypothetical protein
MCLSNNLCHSHIKSISHRVQLCRYHWPFLHTYTTTNDGFSHLFYLYLIHIHIIQLITFVIWQGFLHLLPCMVVRQHKYTNRTTANQDDYPYYLFIFCLENNIRKKIDHDHLVKHENKQLNWLKVVYMNAISLEF